MKTVILYADDFANNGLGMSFEDLLENLGIETTVVVDGKIVVREIDKIELTVADAKVE